MCLPNIVTGGALTFAKWIAWMTPVSLPRTQGCDGAWRKSRVNCQFEIENDCRKCGVIPSVWKASLSSRIRDEGSGWFDSLRRQNVTQLVDMRNRVTYAAMCRRTRTSGLSRDRCWCRNAGNWGLTDKQTMASWCECSRNAAGAARPWDRIVDVVDVDGGVRKGVTRWTTIWHYCSGSRLRNSVVTLALW